MPSDEASDGRSLGRRGFLRSAAATGLGLATVGGLGSRYAVERVWAGADSPQWTENFASEETYDDPTGCTGFNKATIGNNFGTAFLEMGRAGVACDPNNTGDDHWEYRFGAFAIANASADHENDGVQAANWVSGQSIDIYAETDVCGGDGPTINALDSYAFEMDASAVNSWYDTDHYAENEDLQDFNDVKYWANEWEQDNGDVDKDSDFVNWDTALAGIGVAAGVGAMVTAPYSLGLLSVSTSAVSLLDAMADGGDRYQADKTDTSIRYDRQPNYVSMPIHYIDFVADVPPDTSLKIEIGQNINWHDDDKICGPIDPNSDLNTGECYQIEIAPNPPPTETSDPTEPTVNTRCYNN